MRLAIAKAAAIMTLTISQMAFGQTSLVQEQNKSPPNSAALRPPNSGGFRGIPMYISFESGATGIAEAERIKLAKNLNSTVSASLGTKTRPCVLVSGMADVSEGTALQVQRLSLRRAEAVAELLRLYGVRREDISLHAKGSEFKYFRAPDIRNAMADINFLLC